MSLMTNAERIGMEKGMEKSISAVHHAVVTILDIKFGEAAQRLNERAYQLRRLEALQNLMERLKFARSVDEAERVFDEIASQSGPQGVMSS